MLWRYDVAKKAKAREHVFLECSGCGNRNYRVSKRVKGGTPKLELKKYCRFERKHTLHKEKRK